MRQTTVERGLKDQFMIDSAGVSGYHAGDSPDPRSTREALVHGVDLSSIRSRQVRDRDFDLFDVILAMDYSHLDDLKAMYLAFDVAGAPIALHLTTAAVII